MGVPLTDVVATAVTASATFTTVLHVLNFSNMGVQIIWGSLNATNGTVRCKASNKYASNYQNLTPNPITMVSASGEHMFNIYDIGYQYIQLEYQPGSNTSGSFEIIAVKKAFG